MYLTKELYLSQYKEDENGKTDRDKLIISHSDYTIPPGKVEKVVVDVLYWRKANAIHQWFVENVQDGEDECKRYYVSKENLGELLCVVKKALKAKNPSDFLPAKSGFFFGSTEYDRWYYADLEYTAKGIAEEIKNFEDGWSYHYQSSW